MPKCRGLPIQVLLHSPLKAHLHSKMVDRYPIVTGGTIGVRSQISRMEDLALKLVKSANITKLNTIKLRTSSKDTLKRTRTPEKQTDRSIGIVSMIVIMIEIETASPRQHTTIPTMLDEKPIAIAVTMADIEEVATAEMTDRFMETVSLGEGEVTTIAAGMEGCTVMLSFLIDAVLREITDEEFSKPPKPLNKQGGLLSYFGNSKSDMVPVHLKVVWKSDEAMRQCMNPALRVIGTFDSWKMPASRILIVQSDPYICKPQSKPPFPCTGQRGREAEPRIFVSLLCWS